MQRQSNPETLTHTSVKRALGTWQRVRHGLVSIHWLAQAHAALAAWGPTAFELGALALAALLFARPLLDFNPQVHPLGSDYSMTVQFHSVWLRLRECGLCFFWNGSINGGGPAFADIFPSSLHPLVVVTTLIWGIVNGSKVAIVGIFLMAGFAQWSLARVLGLGFLARMWSGLLAVLAGNLAGRMQMGWFGVALATAAVALVFPPLVKVALTGSRRAAILLGIVLACAAVAGQGYLQFGLALLLPLVVLLVPWGQPHFKLVLRRYGLALGIAILLGAPFFLPVLVNFGEFSKAIDVNLKGIQPFNLVLENFVMQDPNYFSSDALALRMEPFPALYINFIGWVAVILALAGIRLAHTGKETRVMLFLLGCAVGAVVLASLEPRQFLIEHFPDSGLATFIKSLRSSPVIAGLAVLPILGIGAIGLDRLYTKFTFRLQIALQNPSVLSPFAVPLNWLLVVPLIYSILSAAQANQAWLHPTSYDAGIPHVVHALDTRTTEWVQTPFGEADYLIQAMQAGLKITKYPFAWSWNGRTAPSPLLLAEGKWEPEGTTLVGPINGVSNINLFRAPDENEYATVQDASGTITNCAANANAGDIDVLCNATTLGVLSLKENSWAGWNATVDTQPVALEPGRWLGVELAAGEHAVQFRYRPWDGIVGFLLFGFGCLLCVYLWRKPDPHIKFIPKPAYQTP